MVVSPNALSADFFTGSCKAAAHKANQRNAATVEQLSDGVFNSFLQQHILFFIKTVRSPPIPDPFDQYLISIRTHSVIYPVVDPADSQRSEVCFHLLHYVQSQSRTLTDPLDLTLTCKQP